MSIDQAKTYAKTPSAAQWAELTSWLDSLPEAKVEPAIVAFDAASGHWGTVVDPWSTTPSAASRELRVAPASWVQEIYSDKASAKHRLIRTLHGPKHKASDLRQDGIMGEQCLDNLVLLRFDDVRINGRAFKNWLWSKVLTQITQLSLNRCGLGKGHLEALYKCTLPTIETLRLSGNKLEANGLLALMQLEGWDGLRRIDLSNNGLQQGNDMLYCSPWLGQIEEMDLSHNRFENADIAHVTGGMDKILWLNLAGNPVDLADGIGGFDPTLVALDVSETHVSAATLPRVIGDCPRLTSLSLRKCPIADDGVAALVHSEQAFKVLNLAETQVTAVGLSELLQAPSMQGLERLTLDGSTLSLSNVRRVALGALPNLTELSIVGEIHEAGAAEALGEIDRLEGVLRA